MLNKEHLHKIYIIVSILAIAIYGCLTMRRADGDADSSYHLGYISLILFGLLIPCVFTFVHLRQRGHHIEKPIKILSLLLLWTAIITLFVNVTNIFSAIAPCLSSALIPLMVMLGTYTYSAKYGLDNHIYIAAILVYLLFGVQYYSIYSFANAIGEAHLMTAYYPMFLLPIILMHPSKKIRYMFVVLTIFIIFTSIKRGGFVALIAGLFAYIISRQHIQSRGLKSFIYALLALIAIALIFFFIANSEYGGVIERMASIQEDEGSNRISVWATTWDMIQQSDNLHFIFGHGNNAVLKDSPLFLSGHNDFLEAWYDYGLIGVFLYSFSLLSLVFYTIRLLRKKSIVSPSIAMVLCIVLILTNIAHVLIYYFMTLFCMNIGLFLGHNYFEERNTKKMGQQ